MGRPAGFQSEGRQLGLRPVRRRPAGRGVVQQRSALHQRLLRHPDDPRRGRERALAAVGLGLAREDAQQRRLAGAIAPDQAGAGAGLQGQVHAVEQQHRPIPQSGVLQGEDRGSAHWGAPSDAGGAWSSEDGSS